MILKVKDRSLSFNCTVVAVRLVQNSRKFINANIKMTDRIRELPPSRSCKVHLIGLFDLGFGLKDSSTI